MTTHDTRPATVYWTSVQGTALALGEILLVFGALGFVPGITTNYGQLWWAGTQSGAMLLGVFQVSVLHNLIFVALGIAGLLTARSVSAARTFLLGGGAMFGVLFVYGLLIDKDSAANFLPVNNADNMLHLGVALVMIGLGLSFGYSRAAIRSTMMRPRITG